MMPPVVKAWLHKLTSRQDLLLVALMVMTIIMMILPLPTVLVDMLLAINIALTVLLLMVGIYLKDPVEFSTLPSVILISTVFRLSLSISTTRLILLQADAGHIVSTFGEFVVSGNLIVGLVVFLIITVVQFVVITKGSERVAEVSARFTLDALPGRQMSIDADLRNGDIDQAEAKRRRQTLQKESQLYGAMDGAMKFVKGDAIAGLVIIAVNLLGGIMVGTLQNGSSLGEALETYALLTVGDGLVAQIPALFMSITAGTIVTRVTTEETTNLGSDIASQLAHNTRTLKLAAIVLFGLGLVPGFPLLIFWSLGAILGGTGILFDIRDRKSAALEQERIAAETLLTGDTPASLPSQEVIGLKLASDLRETVDPSIFEARLQRVRKALFEQLGLPFPQIHCAADDSLESGRFRIELDDVPMEDSSLPMGKLLLCDEPDHLELADIPSETAGPFIDRSTTVWIDTEHRSKLDQAGIGYMDTAECLIAGIRHTLSRYASQFIGVQETSEILASADSAYGDLVREAQKVVPLQKMADIFRRLLDEGVPIRNLRIVLDALIEWGSKEQDVILLAEYVRSALKRQICYTYADSQKVIHAFLLERDVEQVLRQAIRQTSVGGYLALSDQDGARLLSTFHQHAERLAADNVHPVILTSLDIRRFLRSLLIKNNIRVPVLSFQDLAPEFTVQPVVTIRIEALSVGQAERQVKQLEADDAQAAADMPAADADAAD
ncbi:MAG: type III secretion system export apparatus subunit SctV [Geminicoccaceae bacterium]